jgi:hypothetical protein
MVRSLGGGPGTCFLRRRLETVRQPFRTLNITFPLTECLAPQALTDRSLSLLRKQNQAGPFLEETSSLAIMKRRL